MLSLSLLGNCKVRCTTHTLTKFKVFESKFIIIKYAGETKKLSPAVASIIHRRFLNQRGRARKWRGPRPARPAPRPPLTTTDALVELVVENVRSWIAHTDGLGLIILPPPPTPCRLPPAASSPRASGNQPFLSKISNSTSPGCACGVQAPASWEIMFAEGEVGGAAWRQKPCDSDCHW